MKSKNIMLDIDDVLLIILLLQTFSANRLVIRHLELYVAIAGIALCLLKFVRSSTLFLSLDCKIWLMFGAYIALSMTWTLSSDKTIRYLLIFLYAAALLMVVNHKIFIRKYLMIVTAGCIVFAATIVAEFFLPSIVTDYFSFLFESKADIIAFKFGERYINAYSGIVGEKADAAYFMCLGLALIFAEGFAKRRFTRIKIILILLLFAALLLTGKRMLFLISILIPLFLIMISDKKTESKIIQLVGIAFAAIISFAIIINVVPELGNVFDRFSGSISGDTALEERYGLWSICKDMFRDSPVLGLGLASFNGYAYRYGGMGGANAHNIYIQLLGETGLVGCTILICFIISIVIKNINLYRIRKSLDQDELYWLYYSFCGQLIFLLYGLSGNTIYYWFQFIMFFMCLLITNIISFQHCWNDKSLALLRGEHG